MAHFARLNSDNIVTDVIVINDADSGGGTLDTENTGITFCQNLVGDNSSGWKQTSYTKSFRGNYAGVGCTYMTGVRTLGVASTDIFIKEQPAPSWSVGIQTAKWYPPDPPGEAPVLTDSERAAGKFYVWNETCLLYTSPSPRD